MRFYLDFMEDITATTTIYELTYFVSRYYGILSEIVKDKDLTDEENIFQFVDEFRHIQYSPNLTIMNNVSFLNIDDINDLLERKYSMHGIKVNVVVDDKEILNIMSDLKYLMRWQNLKLIGISPEDIKILLLVDEKINALD